MKKYIYPLIVTWTVTYGVPGPCNKNQAPNAYLGACIEQIKFKGEKRFTEKVDYEAWVKDIPKTDPRFTISDLTVYEYDDKRTPAINK